MKRRKKQTDQAGIDDVVASDKKKKGITRWQFRRFVCVCGWLLIICSIGMSVYRNYTVVDTITIVEQETVIEKVYNVSGVEEFVKNFASVYFSYQVESDARNERLEKLEVYLQKDLYDMNRSLAYEVKEAVTVSKVEVWEVESLNEANTDFKVKFIVKQKVKDATDVTAYTTHVHTDNNAYVITKNPTLTNLYERSGYEQERLKSDELLDLDVQKDITEFLETFFSVYPGLTEKELVYYVKDASIKELGKDYDFLAVQDISIHETENGLWEVACFISYKDSAMDTVLLNQYDLVLNTNETGNYVISEMR